MSKNNFSSIFETLYLKTNIVWHTKWDGKNGFGHESCLFFKIQKSPENGRIFVVFVVDPEHVLHIYPMQF